MKALNAIRAVKTVKSMKTAKSSSKTQHSLKSVTKSDKLREKIIQREKAKAAKKKQREVEKATQNLMVHAEEEKRRREKERMNKFPCCFFIPLDIVMIFFGLVDIIYYTMFAFVWVIFIAYEPFAGRNAGVAKNTTLYSGQIGALMRALSMPNAMARGLDADYDSEEKDHEWAESSTTLGPPNFFDEFDKDKQLTARVFSRLASHYRQYGQEIDDNCGDDYYENFLYNRQLEITRELFEQLSKEIILSSLVFAILSGVLLTCVCCFRGHKISKFIIILLWYAQLIPILVTIKCLVMSQSHRLCIMEYGMGTEFRGQTCIFFFLLLPLTVYKPYELFVWSCYINRFFQNINSCLTDESYFSSSRMERRAQKKLLEQDFKATDVHDYKHRYQPDVMNQLFKKAQHHKHHAPPPVSPMKKLFPWWGSNTKTAPKPHHDKSSSSSD